MADIPLRIVKSMKDLQDWCYSTRCNKCPNCKECTLGDTLYSRSDYQMITDDDIKRAEVKKCQINLWR